MDFGERLSSLIEEKGLNNLALSKEIGTSDRLIGSWRKGEKRPSFENLILLSDFFDVTLDYLCCRSNERIRSRESPLDCEVSDNVRKMLEYFAELPDEQQRELIVEARTYHKIFAKGKTDQASGMVG